MNAVRLATLLLAFVSACAHSPPADPRGPCCVEPSGQTSARAACEARGCSYGPAPRCAGVKDEDPEARRAAAAACQLPCACTCQEDRQRCAESP
jgi:hypothetical protein